MANAKKEGTFKRVKNREEKTKSHDNENKTSSNGDVAIYSKEKTSGINFSEIVKELSLLTGSSVEKIKDECCLSQIQKIMAKTGKVVVRSNLTDSKMEEILLSAVELKIGEILIAPTYLGAIKRQVEKKGLSSQKINLLIDFPFGESSFKSKMTELKIGRDEGVDEVTVVLPTALFSDRNKKELYWQTKKFAKAFKGNTSVAISVQELKEEQIRTAIDAVEKSAIKSIIFIFGNTTEEELSEKISVINSLNSKKPISIIASVQSVKGLRILLDFNLERVFTPYADEIGKELIKKFKVKITN